MASITLNVCASKERGMATVLRIECLHECGDRERVRQLLFSRIECVDECKEREGEGVATTTLNMCVSVKMGRGCGYNNTTRIEYVDECMERESGRERERVWLQQH